MFLISYLEDGNCKISNNLSKISIKNVVIGRKSRLFSNTRDGANTTVQFFTIVEIAKANGLDPQKYIKFLLDQRLDDQATNECLEEHAPWNSKVQGICK